MGPTRSALLAAASLVVAACPSGTLAGPGDACVGPGCDGGCEGGCDGDADGGFDPCDSIVCPSGQRCVDGRCRSEDPCEGVRCDNPGEVCDRRDGACHPGGADDDGDGSTIAEGDCDDGDPSVHPGAAETCDGVDEDCDLEVDEGFPDADGDGFDTCGFGRPEQADCDDADARSRPGGREQCDGRDNDCDGAVDEGLLARPCATACGEGEERCVAGGWLCSAPETCECAPAGRVEAEGCGLCGSRERTCGADLAWGPWTECLGQGSCAPSETGSCTTACGSSGSRACDAGCAWGPCAPPAESCNGVDDDCDGEVDEGWRAATMDARYGTLVSYHSSCDGVTHRWDIVCAAAIHRYCWARGCTTSGFGPIENDADTAWFACTAGVTVLDVPWAELTARHPGCAPASSVYGPDCSAAVSRYCQALGAPSGFGPVEVAPATATVACLSAGEVVSTTYGTLASHHASCDGVTERWGPSCNAAVSRFCASRGRTSGFGPVENSGDTAVVTCVSP